MREVERAYHACRRHKRATARACGYEQRLLDHLVATRDALQDQTWRPLPPVVFTVEKPKAREVYAAQYEDRVVHHWLAPQLEAAIDRDFIHDAASNRRGKGTHFAVDRVQTFQSRYFLGRFPGCRLIVQCGRELLLSAAWPGAAPYTGAARITAWSVPIGALPALRRYAQRGASSYLFVSEQGYLKGGLKRRIVREIWLNASDARTLIESLFPPHGEDR